MFVSNFEFNTGYKTICESCLVFESVRKMLKSEIFTFHNY